MDRLDSMSTLVAAVEAGSLSAASRKLGMPLATVSRKVSELEAHLQTQLVDADQPAADADRRRPVYVASCKRILEQIGEAERAASGEYSAPRGDLTITAPIVFGRLHVLPIIADSSEPIPTSTSGWSGRPGRQPSGRTCRRRNPDRRTAGQQHDRHKDRLDPPRGVRKPELLGTARRAAGPRRTQQRTTASRSTGCPRRTTWTFRKGKSEVAAPIHSRLVVNTAEAAIEAAIVGHRDHARAFLPDRHGSSLRFARDCARGFEPAPWPVSMVYAEQARLPLKLRAFIDFAGPRLKARLAESVA